MKNKGAHAYARRWNIEIVRKGIEMNKINTSGLLLRVFLPTVALSALYLLFGWFCRSMPHILLLCLIGLFTMVPLELGFFCTTAKGNTGNIP